MNTKMIENRSYTDRPNFTLEKWLFDCDMNYERIKMF